MGWAARSLPGCGLTQPRSLPGCGLTQPRVVASPRRPHFRRMTSQGSAHGRFTRAIKQRYLFAAELAARELRGLALLDALELVALIAQVRPDRLEPVAIRWHGRLEIEAKSLTSPSRGSRSPHSNVCRKTRSSSSLCGVYFVMRALPRFGRLTREIVSR
jgi:hypothetical protein